MRQPDPVLICALSARALAEAARAAGFSPIVLDAFGDLDTRAAAAAWKRIPVDGSWRLRRRPLLAAAAALAPPPIPLVWGSGFERTPELIAGLAAGRELLGCGPGLVRAVKDPFAFATAAARLGVPHPEVRRSPPAAPTGWLAKRAGAAGGGHVRRAGLRAPRGRGWYWQRRAGGTPVSALVVGNGTDARVLGFGHQLVAPSPGHRYRFGGTLAPAILSPGARRRFEVAALRLAVHFSLRGLASVDGLVDGDEVTVLELNPRPGGSLDAYRAALGLDLFTIHAAACRDGVLPSPVAATWTAGTLIVYATKSTRAPAGFPWPDWTADRTPLGVAIAAGGPICTVLAEGRDAADTRAQLARRARDVRDALGAPAGRKPASSPWPDLWRLAAPL